MFPVHMLVNITLLASCFLITKNAYADELNCENLKDTTVFSLGLQDRYSSLQTQIVFLEAGKKNEAADLFVLEKDLVNLNRLHAFGYITLAEILAHKIRIDTAKLNIRMFSRDIANLKNTMGITVINHKSTCFLPDGEQDLEALLTLDHSYIEKWSLSIEMTADEISLERRLLEQNLRVLNWKRLMYARGIVQEIEVLREEAMVVKNENNVEAHENFLKIVNEHLVALRQTARAFGKLKR